MSKSTMVAFGCDGPDCDSQHLTDDVFTSAPAGWFKVTGGDTEAHHFDMDEGAVLCSRLCLYEWVTARLFNAGRWTP
jgi:hypothetical protein